MNGVNFRYDKYMNGPCFSLGLVYENEAVMEGHTNFQGLNVCEFVLFPGVRCC